MPCNVSWRPPGDLSNYDLWRQDASGAPGAFPGSPTYGLNGTYGDDATYSGYIFGARAVEIIEAHNHTAAPIFMYLALHNTHTPVEAPDRFVALYNFGNDTLRDRFHGMVSVVDEVVANVSAALRRKAGMWERTLLIWTTDNGSPVEVAGSNHPLKGGKGTNCASTPAGRNPSTSALSPLVSIRRPLGSLALAAPLASMVRCMQQLHDGVRR